MTEQWIIDSDAYMELHKKLTKIINDEQMPVFIIISILEEIKHGILKNAQTEDPL